MKKALVRVNVRGEFQELPGWKLEHIPGLVIAHGVGDDKAWCLYHEGSGKYITLGRTRKECAAVAEALAAYDWTLSAKELLPLYHEGIREVLDAHYAQLYALGA